MRELVFLSPDGLLHEMVLAVIGQNHMSLLGGVATDIRTKHDGVWCLSTKILHLALAADERKREDSFYSLIVQIGIR